MFDNKTSVLLILPQNVVDRARAFAGEATMNFKRSVSLQMVLRAFVDEGLSRHGDRAVLANVARQVEVVRQIRRRAEGQRNEPPTGLRKVSNGSAKVGRR
jgi:hypothetical protein